MMIRFDWRSLHVLLLCGLMATACTCDAESTDDPEEDAAVEDADTTDDSSVQDASTDPDSSVDDDGSVGDASTDDASTDASTDATVPPSCTGTPSVCSSLGQINCGFVTGCATASGGTCAGTPAACATLTDATVCARSTGCTSNGTCAGAGQCAALTNPALCLIASCTWTQTSCTGTPEACAGRNELTCVGGCAMEGACAGTADACATKTTEGACLLQGCTWD